MEKRGVAIHVAMARRDSVECSVSWSCQHIQDLRENEYSRPLSIRPKSHRPPPPVEAVLTASGGFDQDVKILRSPGSPASGRRVSEVSDSISEMSKDAERQADPLCL